MSSFRNIFVRLALVGIFSGLSLGSARADLVGIEYFDSASNPQFGGPLWRGVVDTVADTLQIDFWTELPRHSDDFWVPVNLPVVWNAVDSTGARFDVPDTFGLNGVIDFGVDGVIDPADDFAFVSPVSLQDTDWYAYDTINEMVDKSQVVQFSGATVFFPGWGGYAFEHPVNGKTYQTEQPQLNGDPFDYLMIPTLPVSATVAKASTFATITVVPEPSAFLGVGLIGSVCVAGVWVHKKATFVRSGSQTADTAGRRPASSSSC